MPMMSFAVQEIQIPTKIEKLENIVMECVLDEQHWFINECGHYENFPRLPILDKLLEIDAEYYLTMYLKVILGFETNDKYNTRYLPYDEAIEYLISAGYDLSPTKELLYKAASDYTFTVEHRAPPDYSPLHQELVFPGLQPLLDNYFKEDKINV